MSNEILALVPVYNGAMNTTVIIYTNLTRKDLKVSIKTAVSRLFRAFLYDERLYNERIRNFTKKRNSLPLVFSKHRLVAFPYRRPRSKSDGSYIYLNRNCIYDFDDASVYVQGFGKVDLLCKKRTIRENLNDFDKVMQARDLIFK